MGHQKPPELKDTDYSVASLHTFPAADFAPGATVTTAGWALGVYRGLHRKHLRSYLDKFVFRFNRRRTQHAAFHSFSAFGAGHTALS